MNDIQKALKSAFDALSAIPVSGDGVELMAVARASLKAAFRLAGAGEAETKKSTEAAT